MHQVDGVEIVAAYRLIRCY